MTAEEKSPIWDGVTQADMLSTDQAERRLRLADAARSYDWSTVLSLSRHDQDLVNVARPGSTRLFAPLHQAAHGNAPMAVVAELIDLGAWRTLRTATGERPVDVAQRKGHHELTALLEPDLKRNLPGDELRAIRDAFHRVIRGRAAELVEEGRLRLPELEPLLEYDIVKFWFAVPGMYGGFAYELIIDGAGAKLVAESWCRVVEGSGERHEITTAGAGLVDSGFV